MWSHQRSNMSVGLTTLVILGLALPHVPVAEAQNTWHKENGTGNPPGPGDPSESDPGEQHSAGHAFEAIQEALVPASGAQDRDYLVYTKDGVLRAGPAPAEPRPRPRSQVIELPVVNPGAEMGTTAGWQNPDGIYYATQAGTPREGSWFFQTEEYLGLGQDRGMTQMVDVSSHTGTIEDVVVSGSMAASYGHAEIDTNGAGDPQTWSYFASIGARLYDSSLSFLGGGGPLAYGDDSLTWTDRELGLDFLSYWENIKSQVAYIEFELRGGWVNDQTYIVEDPPAGSITDIPEVTRFDMIGLSIVVEGGDDHGDNCGTATPLIVGGPPTGGVIDPASDEDWFSFSVEADHLYEIDFDVSTSGFWDGLGVEACAEDCTTRVASGRWFVASLSGTRYLRVFSSFYMEEGSYEVSVVDHGGAFDDHGNHCDTATLISANGTVAPGEVDYDYDVDCFRFIGAEGGVYSVEIRALLGGSCIEGLLSRLGGGGGQVFAGEVWTCEEDGWQEILSYVPLGEAGDHCLSVFGVDDTGAYEVRVSLVTVVGPDAHADDCSTATSLTVDTGPTSGFIEPDTDEDWFSFTVEENHLYEVPLDGSWFDRQSVAYLPDCTTAIAGSRPFFWEETSTDPATFVAASPGTRYLQVFAAWADGGYYEVQVVDRGVASDDHGNGTGVATPVPTDWTVVPGEINYQYDVDYFWFTVPDGGEYTLGLQALPGSGPGCIEAELYRDVGDPFPWEWLQACEGEGWDDAVITLEVSRGNYYMRVVHGQDNTGPYEVRVTLAAECSEDADCDDGQFCTGVEACVEGVCQPGANPCSAGQTCNEDTDQCEGGGGGGGGGTQPPDEDGGGGGGGGTQPPDEDGDGVADGADACPGTLPDADVDTNGCSCDQLDDDGDQVNNCDDTCPETPVGEAVEVNGCSCGQLDDDGDGVDNCDDNCPNTVPGETVDEVGCADSQRDEDGDGVFANLDVCPDTPAGEAVDSDGCSCLQRDRDGDDDGDGVLNCLDDCADTPADETVDADGCSCLQLDPDGDDDEDGALNCLDQCPQTPADEAVDANGCSCWQLDPDGDDDGDGVLNCLDLCPNTPAGEAVDANGCSCLQLDPDGDDDGDGVLNCLDDCPETPAGAVVNDAGCPELEAGEQLPENADDADTVGSGPETASGTGRTGSSRRAAPCGLIGLINFALTFAGLWVVRVSRHMRPRQAS